MQIDMQSRDLPLTPPIQDYIRRRLGFALGAQYQSIKHIMVRLSDLNGPRGGNDMRCQLLIKLNSKAEVVIEDTQAQIKVAIDRAASRASRTVTRKVARLRNKGLRAAVVPVPTATTEFQVQGSLEGGDHSTANGYSSKHSAQGVKQ